jgi:ABC-type Co2+ transport system permease subunit
VRIKGKRPVLFFGTLTASSAFLVVLLIWALSKPHRAIEYMVAGTFITAVGLLAAFVYLVLRQQSASKRRTAPENVRSS